MNELLLTESCLNHARYHGLLPSHVDVQGVMRGLSRTVVAWTADQRAEAHAWCEQIRAPGSDPAPAHAAALIQRASRTEAA